MGYTHFWQRAPNLPAKAFRAAVTDSHRVLAQTGVLLVGPLGDGSPMFRPDAIAFNGVGQSGGEAFQIIRNEPPRNRRNLHFCKTNRQPYDLCVQITLIICAHHFGKSFQVSSDGGDSDWETARRLCQQHLRYGQEFVLTRS